jgi:hypothetical protein
MALGVPMLEVWGMTETGSVAIGTPIDRIKPGSIGIANAPNEVKLSDEGEILVRGPNVFMGYLNLPEKTAETIDAEGWLHTGDVGPVDADNYFRISDRLKDIITHRRRQEHHAFRVGEPAQVLALRDRRGGHRRQETLPGLPDHDRPGERREVCPGQRRAPSPTTPA